VFPPSLENLFRRQAGISIGFLDWSWFRRTPPAAKTLDSVEFGVQTILIDSLLCLFSQSVILHLMVQFSACIKYPLKPPALLNQLPTTSEGFLFKYIECQICHPRFSDVIGCLVVPFIYIIQLQLYDVYKTVIVYSTVII